MNLNINNISKILEAISLNNTFLFLGAVVVIISVFTQYDIGLKIGLITLVFGGLFRVQLHINKALPTNRRRDSKTRLFVINMIKLGLWILTLFLYIYCVNKIYQIF